MDTKLHDKKEEYIEDLLTILDANIKIVGGHGICHEHSDLRKMGFVELATHLFNNGIEFKIKNRRVLEKDPLRSND